MIMITFTNTMRTLFTPLSLVRISTTPTTLSSCNSSNDDDYDDDDDDDDGDDNDDEMKMITVKCFVLI